MSKHLGRNDYLQVLLNSFKLFLSKDLFHHAAAITYFAVLALFPTAILVFSAFSIMGDQDAIDSILQALDNAGLSQGEINTLDKTLSKAVQANGAAVSISLLISTLVAINVAAKAFEAAGKSLNIIYGLTEGRSFFPRRLQAVRGALVVILLGFIARSAFFLGEGTDYWYWQVIRYGLTFFFAWAAYAWVYYYAPDLHRKKISRVAGSALIAVVLWLLASSAFLIYAKKFATYDVVYGVFAGAIALLVWIWVTNVVFLYGAALNQAARDYLGLDNQSRYDDDR